jgi:hypothetical protein
MKKITFILGFIFALNSTVAQVVGTPYIATDSRPVLDQLGINPSFAFSTRKLRSGYSGFALRIRRSTDNAQADVA